MHCRRCCLSAAFALHLCCCGGGFCCCCFCCFPFFLLHCGCCALKYALFLRVSAHFWHNWSTNSAGCLPRLWLAPKVALATWHCVYATDSTASGQRNLLAQVLHGNFASKRARQTMQQQQQQRQQQQQQQQQKYQWQSLLPAYACTPPTPPLPLLHPCWVRIFLMSFFFVATAASRHSPSSRPLSLCLYRKFAILAQFTPRPPCRPAHTFASPIPTAVTRRTKPN